VLSLFSLIHFLTLMLVLFSLGLIADILRVTGNLINHRTTTKPWLLLCWRIVAVAWVVNLLCCI
jgi:hypothetical protein